MFALLVVSIFSTIISGMKIPQQEVQNELNATFSFEDDDYYNDIGKKGLIESLYLFKII